jgi:hypothetical protein
VHITTDNVAPSFMVLCAPHFYFIIFFIFFSSSSSYSTGLFF